MGESFTTLTGRWLGRYGYGGSSGAVSFEAELVQEGSDLSGDVHEPNTFRDDAGAELHAVISGTVAVPDVSFVKHYLGFEQGDDPVYTGQANAGLTRISGTWNFPKNRALSGAFVMMRKPIAATRARRREVEAPVLVTTPR